MDKCPSGQMSNGLLSAWTIVRMDYYPQGRLSSYPSDIRQVNLKRFSFINVHALLKILHKTICLHPVIKYQFWYCLNKGYGFRQVNLESSSMINVHAFKNILKTICLQIVIKDQIWNFAERILNALLEFSDFTLHSCSHFHPTLQMFLPASLIRKCWTHTNSSVLNSLFALEK